MQSNWWNPDESGDRRKLLIGMLHVGALPGTPRASAPLTELIEQTVSEAAHYADAGFDALILENMHDLPYLADEVGPEVVASMTAVGCAAREAAPLPLGIQVLAGANRAALAVALACGATFIRAENFVFAHVADEGLMPKAAAGPLLRYRRQIGADHIRVLADIKKKHAAHAITADVDLRETAKAAEFAGADGVIVTGAATAAETSPEDVAAVRHVTTRPIFVGSGVTPGNLPDLWNHADAFIVGSYCKHDGRWDQPVDPRRLTAIMEAASDLR